jgi:hypothetical protein
MAIRYLVTDKDGKGHLPVSGEDGKLDHRLMAAAHAALFSNYRGNPYAGPNKEEAKAKLRALYKSEGMEWPEEQESGARTQKSEENASASLRLGLWCCWRNRRRQD